MTSKQKHTINNDRADSASKYDDAKQNQNNERKPTDKHDQRDVDGKNPRMPISTSKGQSNTPMNLRKERT